MKRLGWLILWFGAFAVGCGGSAGGGDGGTGDGGMIVCGDGVVQGDEQCDDGNTDDGDGCDSECFIEGICGDGEVEGREECEDGDSDCNPPGHIRECRYIRSAFRMSSFGLTDPAIRSGGTRCGNNILPIFVNPSLTATVQGDTDIAGPEAIDGLVDLGFVFTFAPLKQGDGESTKGEFVISDCNVLESPGGPTPCAPTNPQDPPASFSVATQASGTCLDAKEGTTGPDLDPVEPVVAGDHGCWVSEPFDFAVALGSVALIPISETQIAAQWDADPATGLLNGLIRGFLTEEDACEIELDIPPLVGRLCDFLSPAPFPFGCENDPEVDCRFTNDECQHHDTGPNDERGFWMYFPFTAEQVPWAGGVMCGDGDVDVPGVLGPGNAERDELCDTAIDSGEGECTPLVVDCVDDGATCMDRTVNSGDACAPRCYSREIKEIIDGDDCCPERGEPGSAPANAGAEDEECLALCGNGVLDQNETCEPGIGDGCDSIAECDDEDPCTRDLLKQPGFPGRNAANECTCPTGTCTQCAHLPIPDAADAL